MTGTKQWLHLLLWLPSIAPIDHPNYSSTTEFKMSKTNGFEVGYEVDFEASSRFGGVLVAFG